MISVNVSTVAPVPVSRTGSIVLLSNIGRSCSALHNLVRETGTRASITGRTRVRRK